ncbi:hypothetical protein Tco_1523632 [Tanacetum coccineum]
MGRYTTKEDDVDRISHLSLLRNLSDNVSAKELFLACKQYGHVVDSYIPVKKSKYGKRVKVFASLANLKMALGNEGFSDIVIKYMGEQWVMYNEFEVDGRIAWVEVKVFLSSYGTNISFTELLEKWGKLLDVDVQDETAKIVIREDFKITHEMITPWYEEDEVKRTESRMNIVMVAEIVPESLFEDGELENNHVDDTPITEDSWKHPPGFTPLTHNCENDTSEKKVDQNDEFSEAGDVDKLKGSANGSISAGHFKVRGFKMEGVIAIWKNSLDTQGGKEDWDFCVKRVGGNSVFDYVYSEAVGNSGGILCVWDTNSFCKNSVTVSDYFVITRGFEVDKRIRGLFIIMGDFNEVRVKSDRFGTHFNPHGAHRFNSFILDSGLVEVNLVEARTLKLLIGGFLSVHRLFFLKENVTIYGPTPFRFFHHWLEMDGFNTFIRIWNKSNSGTRKNDQLRLKKQLEEIDLDIDRGLGNEELVNSRLAILHQIQKIDNLESKERAQKAKIKWAVEGDENSGFFHGIINKRRNIQNIRGVMVDGNWIENPNDVKKEFFDHFANRFGKPDKPTASISLDFPNQISHEQSDHMERDFTIKKEKSLDYNNSFLGEYECSYLALDREEKRDEKEEIGSLETRSNNVSDQEI